MESLFKRIEESRIKRGHSIEAACAAIHISRSTWDKWKRGEVEPRAASKELAERYINDGQDGKP